MPTRKQRRREAKQKRHEYEFVYVDEEGHELDERPDEDVAPAREERRNGRAAAKVPAKGAKGRPQPQRGGRAARAPQPPSWQRAGKRSLLLGAVIFALFYMTAKKGTNRILGAAELAVIYTALFVPFTYAIDRFAYNRYLRRGEAGGRQGGKKPATKR